MIEKQDIYTEIFRPHLPRLVDDKGVINLKLTEEILREETWDHTIDLNLAEQVIASLRDRF